MMHQASISVKLFITEIPRHAIDKPRRLWYNTTYS
jgi:hypothetical protein